LEVTDVGGAVGETSEELVIRVWIIEIVLKVIKGVCHVDAARWILRQVFWNKEEGKEVI
jgi:hypothetical protein